MNHGTEQVNERAATAGRPRRAVAAVGNGLAVGVPSYDAVLAEHTPRMPGGTSCRACGFVYIDQPTCPALVLAEAGFAEMADRVRVVPAADRGYGALCELTVEVQRMGARLEVIAASVAAVAPAQSRDRRRPRLARIVSVRGAGGPR